MAAGGVLSYFVSPFDQVFRRQRRRGRGAGEIPIKDMDPDAVRGRHRSSISGFVPLLTRNVVYPLVLKRSMSCGQPAVQRGLTREGDCHVTGIQRLPPPLLRYGIVEHRIVSGQRLFLESMDSCEDVSGGHSSSSTASCSKDRQQKRQRWLQRSVGVIWTQR